MKLTINNRYKELLLKYAGDSEIRELLDLVHLEKRRKFMIHYSKNNAYPEDVDSLDMLQMDLITIDEAYKNNR